MAVVQDNAKEGTDKDGDNSDSKRPLVCVQLGSVEVEALLDPSAAASIISKEMLNQLDASNCQQILSRQEISVLTKG